MTQPGLLGAGFALVGIVAIVDGLVRQRAVQDAVRRGEFACPRDNVLVGLTAAGAALGGLLVVLVIFQI